jgi:hypothetical protein
VLENTKDDEIAAKMIVNKKEAILMLQNREQLALAFIFT